MARLAESAAQVAAAHRLVGYVFNDESAWFKPRKADPDMHYYQTFLDALANALHARGLKLAATIAIMDEIAETTEDVRRRMALSPVDSFPAMDTYYGDFMHFQDRVSYYAPSMHNYAPAFFPSSQELSIQRARAQFEYLSEDALTGGSCPSEAWLWVLPEAFSEPTCVAFLLALYEWKLGGRGEPRAGAEVAVSPCDMAAAEQLPAGTMHVELKRRLRMHELIRLVRTDRVYGKGAWKGEAGCGAGEVAGCGAAVRSARNVFASPCLEAQTSGSAPGVSPASGCGSTVRPPGTGCWSVVRGSLYLIWARIQARSPL